MNFLGILKGTAKVIKPVAEAAVSLFNPALGSLVGRLGSMVVDAEAQIPEDGKGAEKHQFVVNGFNDQLKLAQDFMKLGGRQMTYDGELLDKAIASDVARMNAYALLSKSVKIIDI